MKIYRPVNHILPMATLRKRRLLPRPGRVVVRERQEVKSGSEVAYTSTEPRYRLLDVARMLDVPGPKADEFIVVKPGDRVQAGDVLAERKGLFRKMVTAPEEGEVVLVGDGQVLLRVRSPRYVLTAGVPGEVSKVIEDLGVEIVTRGAVIDGVWGNGKAEFGTLRVLAAAPGDALTADQLSVEMRGLVVVSGSCDDPKALELANELPLRALILGSMRARLVPLALSLDVPVIVLDGFGAFPMNGAAYRLLKSNEGREAAVLADPWDREEGVRPQVILPLNIPDAPEPLPADEVQVGRKVRVVRQPYLGLIGTVVTVPEEMTLLPNGLRVRAADVRLDDGTRVVVPLANLEILA